MDSTSVARLSLVHPWLSHLANDLYSRLLSEGIEIHVIQGLRTYEEQNALYAQGRTAPGRIVTKARAGESWHNFGLAIDVAPFVDGQPDWNGAHLAWKRTVEVGGVVGLYSGISWHDMPHFQLTGRFPVSPTDEVRKIFAEGGLEAVWKAANIKV